MFEQKSFIPQHNHDTMSDEYINMLSTRKNTIKEYLENHDINGVSFYDDLKQHAGQLLNIKTDTRQEAFIDFAIGEIARSKCNYSYFEETPSHGYKQALDIMRLIAKDIKEAQTHSWSDRLQSTAPDSSSSIMR